jgi:hypothetical protein
MRNKMGEFLFILAILQPMHIMPWVSWHSEVLAFLALICMCINQSPVRNLETRGFFHIPMISSILILLAVVVLVMGLAATTFVVCFTTTFVGAVADFFAAATLTGVFAAVLTVFAGVLAAVLVAGFVVVFTGLTGTLALAFAGALADALVGVFTALGAAFLVLVVAISLPEKGADQTLNPNTIISQFS